MTLQVKTSDGLIMRAARRLFRQIGFGARNLIFSYLLISFAHFERRFGAVARVCTALSGRCSPFLACQHALALLREA